MGDNVLSCTFVCSTWSYVHYICVSHPHQKLRCPKVSTSHPNDISIISQIFSNHLQSHISYTNTPYKHSPLILIFSSCFLVNLSTLQNGPFLYFPIIATTFFHSQRPNLFFLNVKSYTKNSRTPMVCFSTKCGPEVLYVGWKESMKTWKCIHIINLWFINSTKNLESPLNSL